MYSSVGTANRCYTAKRSSHFTKPGISLASGCNRGAWKRMPPMPINKQGGEQKIAMGADCCVRLPAGFPASRKMLNTPKKFFLG